MKYTITYIEESKILQKTVDEIHLTSEINKIKKTDLGSFLEMTAFPERKLKEGKILSINITL